jgi:hypothetical protein
MFDSMIKHLDLQTLGKGQKDFSITQEEFESFCKEFLFEEIKGEINLGQAFCKKYNETNYVLLVLPNESAVAHIKKFYVK